MLARAESQFSLRVRERRAARFYEKRGWHSMAGDIGRFPCVLYLDEVPPGIRLAAVEVSEAIDLRELSAGQRLAVPPRHLGILRECGHRAADERRALGDREMRLDLRGVMPSRFGHTVRLEHALDRSHPGVSATAAAP